MIDYLQLYQTVSILVDQIRVLRQILVNLFYKFIKKCIEKYK